MMKVAIAIVLIGASIYITGAVAMASYLTIKRQPEPFVAGVLWPVGIYLWWVSK